MARPQPVRPETLKMFANDLDAYSKVCLKIRTKAAEVKPLRLNYEQGLINDLMKDQYQRIGRNRVVILKARQIGMSTYTAARFFRKIHLWPNQQAVVIADQLSRAETLFGMYDRMAHMLPGEMKPMIRYVTKKRELFFDNPSDRDRYHRPGLQSGISVETAGDAAAGRGSTIQLAHMSEMASWPPSIALDVYISLMQAIPDEGSEVIVESTANGVGNLFHQMWLAAEEGEGKTEGSNGYLAVFFPWWTHAPYTVKLSSSERKMVRDTLDDLETSYVEEGIEWRGQRHKLTLGQIAWRRRTIREKTGGDPRAFRQEYPATPDEAFLVSGSNFFDEDALKDYDQAARPPKRRAHLLKVAGGIVPQKSELGFLRIWETPRARNPLEGPESRGGTYVIGADTSTGRQVAAQVSSLSDPNDERGGSDFSSADVVDVERREVVAQLHGRMAPEVFAEQLYLLGHYYSTELPGGTRRPALLAVEKNHSSGETVINLLKNGCSRHGAYTHLYVHKRLGRRQGNRPTEYIGWMTTVETRMPMLDNLAAALREGWLKVPSRDTIKEMFTFVRGEDGKPQAQEGAHDDRVISLAIAAYVMGQQVWTPPKNYHKKQLASVGNSPTGMSNY